MQTFLLILVTLLASSTAAAALVYAYLRKSTQHAMARLQAETMGRVETILKDAENKAKEIELTAKNDVLHLREALEDEEAGVRRKLADVEARLSKREDNLDAKLDALTGKQHTLDAREQRLDDLRAAADRRAAELDRKSRDAEALLTERRAELERVAGLDAAAARREVIGRVEAELEAETNELIRRRTEAAEAKAKAAARDVILNAIQRYAAEQTSDHTVSSIEIADEAMKGRVIGKEGRNIRAFEKRTGVDVIIDETPGVVSVSCFDPVRRETARLSMHKLIADGRIHPGRIEEVVAETEQEMRDTLVELGEKAAADCHLTFPNALLETLGRLHYRTSYGQNVLKHSQEVAYLSQLIADQLGLDGRLARRAGLLHDLGKALDHEREGGHPRIGHDELKKFGEPEEVLNAALAHHGDEPATTPYTPIVMAADAISASRPGARRESLERYVTRLEELERTCTDFDQGVRQAYAIQAGREVRVIVDAKRLDDKQTARLARDLGKRIEQQHQYPGEIKLTVLREVRTIAYAR